MLKVLGDTYMRKTKEKLTLLIFFMFCLCQLVHANEKSATIDAKSLLQITIHATNTGLSTTLTRIYTDSTSSHIIPEADFRDNQVSTYGISCHTPTTLKEYYDNFKLQEADPEFGGGDAFLSAWDYPEEFQKQKDAFLGIDSTTTYQFQKIGDHLYTSTCEFSELCGCYTAIYLTFVDTIRVTIHLQLASNIKAEEAAYEFYKTLLQEMHIRYDSTKNPLILDSCNALESNRPKIICESLKTIFDSFVSRIIINYQP